MGLTATQIETLAKQVYRQFPDCFRRCSASAGWRPSLEAFRAEKSCSGARLQKAAGVAWAAGCSDLGEGYGPPPPTSSSTQVAS